MTECGLVELVCSSCGCLYAGWPSADEVHEPLCPRCKKARLIEIETPGCDSESVGLSDK